MTNEQLRVKAAELMGYEDIKIRVLSNPWEMDLVEEFLSGVKDGVAKVLPQYPTFIAAAWTLVEKMQGMEWLIYNFRGTWSVDVMERTSCPSCSTSSRTTVAAATDDEAPRAITRAFILAMTAERLDSSGKVGDEEA